MSKPRPLPRHAAACAQSRAAGPCDCYTTPANRPPRAGSARAAEVTRARRALVEAVRAPGADQREACAAVVRAVAAIGGSLAIDCLWWESLGRNLSADEAVAGYAGSRGFAMRLLLFTGAYSHEV